MSSSVVDLPPRVAAVLTAREAEVAELLAKGYAAKEIALCLEVSLHTARRHTESIFKKLNVRTRVAAALVLRGLVEGSFSPVARSGDDLLDLRAAS